MGGDSPPYRRENRGADAASDSRVPIEPALAPVRLAKFVGHFDRLDPFRVLVAELGRGAQPQRITERIADDLAGIFGREDSLRMQCGRHIDAFGIIVGANEIDIFRRQIGADALQKIAQVRTGPLADIVPALDANVPDDDFLLGKRVEPLRAPILRVLRRSALSNI